MISATIENTITSVIAKRCFAIVSATISLSGWMDPTGWSLSTE